MAWYVAAGIAAGIAACGAAGISAPVLWCLGCGWYLGAGVVVFWLRRVVHCHVRGRLFIERLIYRGVPTSIARGLALVTRHQSLSLRPYVLN